MYWKYKLVLLYLIVIVVFSDDWNKIVNIVMIRGVWYMMNVCSE